MIPVVIHCDRCKQRISEHITTPECTGGYYNVQQGGAWAGFARPNEMIICDGCMWKDPKYIAEYGVHL